jgi:hypothetical protein
MFMLAELVAFATAALVHFGTIFGGYEHQKAGTAESVIAAVLLVGLTLISFAPERTRSVALGAQGFALLGTFVGIFTIAIGVGPRTLPDIAYHICIVIVLVWGLVTTMRTVAA